MAFTDDSKDRVRDAVDIVELISARTELRRSGPDGFMGRCPFHEERTASFSVSPSKKVYYCFGCQARGDVFTFVQETEGVDFTAALELLAERYRVTLEREAENPEQVRRRERRDRLLALLARTSNYYIEVLWRSGQAERAREYLRSRGLQEEVLRDFRVGFAPSGYDHVLLGSQRAGYTEAELRATGLTTISQQNGRPYDRFRERIVFPLADGRGRVLGFGARALRENQRPKYLNTADGEIYHKGRHLYGADVARAHAARAGVVILCEGYTDVIALHQAGLRHAVGSMGTALTDDQVGELARLAPTVLLAHDGDPSGQEALAKAAELIASRRLELRVVQLPAGRDPADLVQHEGSEAVAELVQRAVPFVRFRVERVLAGGDLRTPEGRDAALQALRPVFAGLPPSVMQQELVRLVASRLELSEALTSSLLAGAGPAAGAAASMATARGRGGEDGNEAAAGRPAPVRRSPLDRREQTERHFLALCVARPEGGAAALAALDLDAYFTGPLERRAAGHLRARLAAPREGLDPDDVELAQLIDELAVRAGALEPTAMALELESLQLDLARIDRQMQAARVERSGEVAALAAERDRVRRAVEDAIERVMGEV
ncbi:MAG TPA: DNA primase [Solirubrobacteraceae bacterium]|nr:DNA primase [Solirubrobacteraceae bacterium]